MNHYITYFGATSLLSLTINMMKIVQFCGNLKAHELSSEVIELFFMSDKLEQNFIKQGNW